MARKISFQGKCVNDDKWVTGKLIREEVLTYGYEKESMNYTYIEVEASPNTKIRYMIIPSTAGQFTNVLGSDGREIYEHDIVTNDICRGVIYWNYEYNGWLVSVIEDCYKMYDVKLDNTFRVVGHHYDELVGIKRCYA